MKDNRGLPTAHELRAGRNDRATAGQAYAQEWAATTKKRGAQKILFAPDPQAFGFDSLDFQRVRTTDEAVKWKWLCDQYHYVPHSGDSIKGFGRYIRYTVASDAGTVAVLAFSGSFLSLGDRDAWIGWTKEQRLKNNRFICQNQVFCITPNGAIPNLASAILGRVEKVIRDDWQDQYGDRLALLDTLVAKEQFTGASYIAANWTKVGETKGMGFKGYRKEVDGYGPENMARAAYNHGIKKWIFCRPLVKDWQKQLTDKLNKGRGPSAKEAERGP